MIEERLKALQAPEATAAMERTVRKAELAAAPIASRSKAGPRRILLVAGLTALAAVLVAVTPPGQAVAGALGDLVGIGDEPTKPLEVQGLDGPGSTVIGLGESPNGTRFEMALTGSVEGSCLYLSYPDIDTTGQIDARCLTRAALNALSQNPVDPSVSIGPEELGSDSDLVLTTIGTGDVASLKISYVGTDGARHEIPKAAGADFAIDSTSGESTPLRYFVGFLPTTILGNPLTLKERQEQVLERFPDLPADNLSLDYETVKKALEGIEVTAYRADGSEIGMFDLPTAFTVPYALANAPDGRFADHP